MARIKNIRFDRAGRNEGCCCDRCGQYLQNIQNDPEDYWYGRDYLEFKNWMLTEFFPCRIREDEKKLKLFSKVEFNR